MGRDVSLPTAFAVVAAAILLSSPVRAENHGVEAAPGEVFRGELGPAGDVDSYVVPVAAGGTLSVAVEVPEGSSLVPTLALRAPNGGAAGIEDRLRVAGGRRLLLRGFRASVTGSWRVDVADAAGGTGPYAISFQTRTPVRTARRRRPLSPGEALEVPFAAGDGTLLSFSVRARHGPLPSSIEIVDPEGAIVPIPEGAIVRRRRHLAARGIPLDSGFGTHVLRVIGAPGVDAVVDAVVHVRTPRPAAREVVLGPEPRPTSLAPNSGRDGIEIRINGSGFQAGARVRFGETWAGDPEVVGPGEIRVLVPDGPESQGGLITKVTVADAFGQENTAPGSFRYLGPPRPTSVTPKYLPPEGGHRIVVAGINFRAGFSLSIGGVAIPDAVLDPLGTISCTAPAHAIGTASIAVTDEFGRTGTLAAGIVYVGPPEAASASPSSASFTGGRAVTLTGTDLLPGVQVEVGGVAAEGETWIDNAHLRFSMPAGPAGTFDVTLRDPFGRTTTAPGLVRRRGPFVDVSAAAVPEPPEGTDFFSTVLALGDLDGDGRPEVVVSSEYPQYDAPSMTYLSATRLLVNEGDGTFRDGTAERLAPWSNPLDLGEGAFLAIGDLDGASGDDVVLSASYAFTSYATTFTRNGKTYAYSAPSYYGYYYVDNVTYAATRLLGNDGTGGLSDAGTPRMALPVSTPAFGYGERWQADAGALGDLDGDGDLDLALASADRVAYGVVVGTTYSGGIHYLIETYAYTASTRVLLNDGTGSFTPKAAALPALSYAPGGGGYGPQLLEGFDGEALSLGDLDGDGDADLVLTASYPRSVYRYYSGGGYAIYYVPATRVLRNDGTGRFSWMTTAMPLSYGLLHPGSYDYGQADASALGDLDGDGDRDLVLGRRAGYWYDASQSKYVLSPAIRIFANNGAGRFTEATSSFLDEGLFRVGGPDVILDAEVLRLGDLDGDGSLDLVVGGGVTYVYDYTGTGYGNYGIVPSGPVLATRVLINDGKGRFEDVSMEWLPEPVNGDRFQASAATLGDLEGDGDLDLVLGFPYWADSYGETLGHNRPLRVLKCE
jgi:hypothetical protein